MEEFKARRAVVNGKPTYIIECNSETIRYPDGRQDVIVHAPAVSVFSKFVKEQKGG